MPITRREALAAAAGCGLATPAEARADEKPPAAPGGRSDPVFGNLPNAVRAVVEDTFPGHRCIRLAERQEKGATVYRVTVFNPADTTVHTQSVGGELVSQPRLYHVELTADGKVIEETYRPVLDLGRLPKPVLAAYQKWNPKGVTGMVVAWSTEVPRGKERIYRAGVIVNQIKAYRVSFKEDGSVIAADPAVVP
jgi:hypothetical protein